MGTPMAGQACVYTGLSCTCRAAVGPGPGGGAAGGSAAGGGAGGAGGAAAAAGAAAVAGAGGAASVARTWRCTGSGAACPATEPATGGACMNPATGGALNCPYPSGGSCRCTNAGTWQCTPPPPPACPAMQPTGTCSTVQACAYGMTQATRVRCECDAKTWGCGAAGAAAPMCMAAAGAALATGDMCTGIGQCPRTAGGGMAAATCVCNGTAVTCN